MVAFRLRNGSRSAVRIQLENWCRSECRRKYENENEKPFNGTPGRGPRGVRKKDSLPKSDDARHQGFDDYDYDLQKKGE